jgi:hypothetical protein
VAAKDSDPSWRIDLLARVLRLCRPGDTVLETGSGIGAHALPIARALGAEGVLYAYEANERTRRLLMRNVAAQRAANVTLLGDFSIDALAPARLDGLKLDDAATVARVLDGADLGYRGWRLDAPAGAERHVLALPEEADLAAAPDGCVEWP